MHHEVTVIKISVKGKEVTPLPIFFVANDRKRYPELQHQLIREMF